MHASELLKAQRVHAGLAEARPTSWCSPVLEALERVGQHTVVRLSVPLLCAGPAGLSGAEGEEDVHVLVVQAAAGSQVVSLVTVRIGVRHEDVTLRCCPGTSLHNVLR